MSAQSIYDLAPLGAIIRFSDGTPRPPDRFKRKLSAWKDRNGQGRLVEKAPETVTGTYTSKAHFTLNTANYGSDGTIVLVVNRVFQVSNDSIFEVVDAPKPPQCLVVTPWATQDRLTLRHVAPNRTMAEAWLQTHRYSDAIIQDVA